MGPGFLMSQAYLDPGNIAGDLDTIADEKPMPEKVVLNVLKRAVTS